MNDISIKRYKLLKKRYREAGLESQYYGNTDKKTKRSLKYDACERLILFLQQYSEQYGLVLPGRVPGFKSADLVLLPSSLTKTELHRQYVVACNAASVDPVGYASFRRVWKQAFPNTVIQKPRSDLCSTCHRNLTSIPVLRGMTDEEKLQKLNEAVAHIDLVKHERRIYTESIAQAREVVQKLPGPKLGSHQPCSLNVQLHISFDYAQQVHIPFDPQQPGEIYFLVPYKVGLFGIMNEGIKKQVAYLIPESVVIGKGSNAVMSYLDHYLDNYVLGEEDFIIHADNCSGKNKNNFLMIHGRGCVDSNFRLMSPWRDVMLQCMTR